MTFDSAGAVNLGSAYGTIIADLSGVQRDLDGQISRMETGLAASLGRLGDRFTAAGRQWSLALAPVTGFVIGGVAAFARFDDILTEIAARTGATADEMQRVRDTALLMGQNTAFSASQAADAMLQLLSSGYNLDQTFQALQPTLDLAAAGQLDLGYAADAVTDILAQYKLGADSAAVVTNALAKASGASSATVTDLIAAFANVGPIASNFGLSVDETAATLAVFAENGIKGSEAGTQLKSMLTQMARNTPEVTSMWNELGISMYDAQGAMRPLDSIITDLADATAGLSDKERNQVIQTLAGSYGQVGLSALLASYGIGDMQEAMEDAATAEELAAARMESLKGKFSQLKSSVETLAINALGPMIDRYLAPLVTKITEVINSLNGWAAAHPDLMAKIGLVLGALAVLGPTLIAIGGVINLVALIVGTLGAAFALLVSPIGIAMLAGAALVAAYVNNFMGLRDFIDNQVRPRLESFIEWLGTIKDTLAPKLAALVESIKAKLGDIPGTAEAVKNDINTALGEIGAGAQAKLDALVLAVKTKLNEIVTAARTVKIDLLTALGGMWDSAKTTAETKLTALETTVRTKFAALVTAAESIKADLNTALGAAWDGAKTTAERKLTVFVSTVKTQFDDLLTSTTTVKDASMRNISDLAGTVGQIGGVIGLLFPPLGAAIVSASLVTRAYASNFLGLRDTLENEVKPRLDTFFEFLRGIDLVAEFETWKEAFTSWAGDIDLAGALNTISFGVTSFILNTGTDIAVKLLTWATKFVQWIGPAIRDILPKLGEYLGTITGWILVTGIPGLVAGMVGMAAAFLQWIANDAIPNLGPALLDFLVAFGTFVVRDLIPGVLGFFTEFGAAIGRAIRDAALSAIGNLLQDVLGDLGSQSGVISSGGVSGGGQMGGNSPIGGGGNLFQGAFASGTPWTGSGPSDQVAGFTHNRESVVPEDGMSVVPSPGGLKLKGSLNLGDLAAILLGGGGGNAFASALGGLGGGGGGNTYAVTVQVPVEVLRDEPRIQERAEQFAEKFMQSIRSR